MVTTAAAFYQRADAFSGEHVALSSIAPAFLGPHKRNLPARLRDADNGDQRDGNVPTADCHRGDVVRRTRQQP